MPSDRHIKLLVPLVILVILIGGIPLVLRKPFESNNFQSFELQDDLRVVVATSKIFPSRNQVDSESKESSHSYYLLNACIWMILIPSVLFVLYVLIRLPKKEVDVEFEQKIITTKPPLKLIFFVLLSLCTVVFSSLYIFQTTFRQNTNLPSNVSLNDDCAVCLEPLNNGDPVTRLTCGHYYHQSCIDQWFTTGSNTCPECRREN